MIEIFTGFILFLMSAGQPMEFTPRESLSDCLATKRKIMRTGANSEMWVCKKGKLKMQKKSDGNFHPIEILED
jgi:hypothetical protein